MKTLVATKEISLEDLIDQVQHNQIVLLRGGKPAAVVMSLDDDDWEWLPRELDPQFIASIAQAREEVRQGKALSHEQVAAMLGVH